MSVYYKVKDHLNAKNVADSDMGADARLLRYGRDKNGEYVFYLTSV